MDLKIDGRKEYIVRFYNKSTMFGFYALFLTDAFKMKF